MVPDKLTNDRHNQTLAEEKNSLAGVLVILSIYAVMSGYIQEKQIATKCNEI